jgi:hypothetical protein
MPFVFKCLALSLSIAAAFAADKETPFRAAPAGEMAYRQKNEQVTVGVEPYDQGDKIKIAFGKLDPNQFRVLPVLVVIQNDSNQTLRLENMRVEYVPPQRGRIMATPPGDVKYLRGPNRPSAVPGPTGQIKIVGKKKNPLDAWEIEGRAFSAKMLTPGQSASGFFYFETGFQRGATIYLNGISEAATGKELFFFEIPML